MKLVSKTVIALFVLGFFATGIAKADGVRIRGLFDRDLVSDASSEVKVDLDEKKDEPKKDRLKKGEWGGFGGAMIQYLRLDLSPLDPMTDDRGVETFEEEMLLIGGLGGVIHNNFRFGGFGFANDQESDDRVLGLRRGADMSISGGGLLFEYNNMLDPQYGVVAGAMIGVGSIDLEASGADLGTDGKWDGDTDFFMAYPYLGVWYAPLSWMWIQLDAGYLYFNMDTSTSEFENDLNVDMTDGDLSGGFQAGLRVVFGYDPAMH